MVVGSNPSKGIDVNPRFPVLYSMYVEVLHWANSPFTEAFQLKKLFKTSLKILQKGQSSQ